jgi:hypothetical protein
VRELLGDRAKDVETISKQIRLNVKPTLRFGVGSN